MRTGFVIFFIWLCQYCTAQTTSLYFTIPEIETQHTKTIAAYINKNFSTDKEKIRAIYSWVTRSIVYDTDSMYYFNWSLSNQASIKETLRRRKGVCENFAGVFNAIAVDAGITSYVVDGYTKQGEQLDNSGHTWCAVHLDGEWLLCDPTWDKDAVGAFRYFLVAPNEFITDHMPFDPMWQLLYKPVTREKFEGSKVTAATIDFYNYPDSIKLFASLNDTAKLAFTARHMQQTGKENSHIKNRIALVNMRLGILNEEKDRENYNYLVAQLNGAIASYNDHVRFLNTNPVNSNNDFLNKALAKLDGAIKQLKTMDIRHPQYDPSTLKTRMLELRKKMEMLRDRNASK